MPPSARHTPGGYVYHALNRAGSAQAVSQRGADYDAFLRVLDDALEEQPLRVVGYYLMPTHWEFVLWPAADGELSSFLRWLTLTHSGRWHKQYHSIGSGDMYQNRFKVFAVPEEEHLLSVLGYVERNPLRAGLVGRPEDWPWSSLACRVAGAEVILRRLYPGPVALAAKWVQLVNEPQSKAELETLSRSVARGHPSRLGILAASGGPAFGLAVDDPDTGPAAETTIRDAKQQLIIRSIPFFLPFF